MNNSELYFCKLPTRSRSYSNDNETGSGKECLSNLSTEKSRTHKHAKKCKRSLSGGSSSDESFDEKCKKSKKRKHKKKCKKRHKKEKQLRKMKSQAKHDESLVRPSNTNKTEDTETYGPQIPEEVVLKAQAMAPMTKEKWDEKNNTIRRVYDEETGRNRLIRGDGEVIEEIVSHKRHCEINKQATLSSGAYFQAKLASKSLCSTVYKYK